MIEVKKKQKVSIFITLCAIYLFCTPLDFLPILPNVSFSIVKILVLLPLWGALLELGKFSKANKRVFPLLLYFIVAGLTLVYTIDRGKALERFISIGLNTILIFILSLRQYRKDEFQYLLKAYVYSAWLLLFLIIFYSRTTIMDERRLTLVINGQAQDPNYLTGFFTFSICYYLWKFIQEKKKKYLLCVIIFFIPIFFTGSRGGLVANGIAAFFILFFERKKINFSNIIVATIASILLLAITWRFLPEYIKVRYSLNFTESDGGAHRFEIWKSCLETFKRASILRKLFGFGANSIWHFTSNKGVAHNLFLEFLLEYGIIGTLAILGMLGYYIILAYKTKEYYMVATFIGYLAMMLSLSLYSYKPIWNILLFIILTTKVIKDEKIKNGKTYGLKGKIQ